MSKETSKRIARIAALGIRKPQTLTYDEIKSLAASVLAQKEKDREVFAQAVEAAVEAQKGGETE